MSDQSSPTDGRSSSVTVDDVRSPRQRVLLSILADADRPLRTTELAHMTGQTLGATAHHVRALARTGHIDWAGERRVRGAMQTFYRPSEAGHMALRRPRTEALLTIVGARASYDGHAPGVPSLDEAAQRELEELVERIRPVVEGIVREATSE